MKIEKYNGYTNYETWLVGMWIDNEEALLYDVLELVDSEFKWNFERDEALEEYMTDYVFNNKMTGYGLKVDLILGALSRVDWTELVKGYLLQIAENRKYDEVVVGDKADCYPEVDCEVPTVYEDEFRGIAKGAE